MTLLAELLRRWGWEEIQVRRILSWLISYRRGVWIRHATAGDYWTVLAFAKQIEIWRAAGNEVRDAVSMMISCVSRGFAPLDDNFRLAQSAWRVIELEDPRPEPECMRELWATIGAGLFAPAVAG